MRPPCSVPVVQCGEAQHGVVLCVDLLTLGFCDGSIAHDCDAACAAPSMQCQASGIVRVWDIALLRVYSQSSLMKTAHEMAMIGKQGYECGTDKCQLHDDELLATLL